MAVLKSMEPSAAIFWLGEPKYSLTNCESADEIVALVWEPSQYRLAFPAAIAVVSADAWADPKMTNAHALADARARSMTTSARALLASIVPSVTKVWSERSRLPATAFHV